MNQMKIWFILALNLVIFFSTNITVEMSKMKRNYLKRNDQDDSNELYYSMIWMSTHLYSTFSQLLIKLPVINFI